MQEQGCGIPMAVCLVNNVSTKHGVFFEIFNNQYKCVRIPRIDKFASLAKIPVMECHEWKAGDKVRVKPKQVTPYTKLWLKGRLAALYNKKKIPR